MSLGELKFFSDILIYIFKVVGCVENSKTDTIDEYL